jgi:hypothetical protein
MCMGPRVCHRNDGASADFRRRGRPAREAAVQLRVCVICKPRRSTSRKPTQVGCTVFQAFMATPIHAFEQDESQVTHVQYAPRKFAGQVANDHGVIAGTPTTVQYSTVQYYERYLIIKSPAASPLRHPTPKDHAICQSQ